jgi:molybdopterin-containing oxidoreductase family iron-sulfur binding subunit
MERQLLSAGSQKLEAGSLKLEAQSMDFSAIRSRLAGSEGRLYWRSLGELSDSPEFREYLHREFPEQASEWNDPKGRREFLKLMSASLALAGVGACTRQPQESIVPYVRQPEDIVPGRPLFYASAVVHGGYARPVLVESHMGRPTKIEGNPDHPASLGAADPFTQAEILNLYDPDRAKIVTEQAAPRSWGQFLTAVQTALSEQKARGGAGLRFLTGPITSPSLAALMAEILTANPQATWHQFDPTGMQGHAVGEGRPICHFDQADIVVTLDADFVGCGAGSIRYQREFATRRRPMDDTKQTNRLYAIESTPTLTGAKADHRLAVQASEIEAIARELAVAVGSTVSSSPEPRAPSRDSAVTSKWVTAIAQDLQAHRGRSLVVAGDFQPAAVHRLARSMNEALGNVGATVTYAAEVEAMPTDRFASIADLARAMEAGEVQFLMILGGNPAFTAPSDLKFGEKMSKVRVVAYHGMYVDETAHLAHWNLPAAHALESWDDARAFDGTVTLTQPLIAPLYEGRSSHEVVALFTAQGGRRGLQIVKDYWTGAYSSGAQWTITSPDEEPFPNADAFWKRALHDGFISGTAVGPASGSGLPASADPGTGAGSRQPTGSREPEAGSLEIIFRPDPTIWDGSFANNGWLQELPKPLSKITWDGSAWISIRLAEELGLQNHDVVELRYRGQTMKMPVWLMAGHPERSVTVFFGYGRTMAGRVGNAPEQAREFNAYRLRTSDAPWFGRGLEISKTGERYLLATTQDHQVMEGRAPVRVASIEEYRTDPSVIAHQVHSFPKTLTLYPEHVYDGYKWGMAIDLTSCTGCGACTIACVAENNIPVVGKEQVLRGREMHWIRVDHYFEGSFEDPKTYHQPVPCMHCETAPCEVVCPVAATTHSSEGLNDMVYNRCVGTRYCSNNCPYKVRRFNFLEYADWYTTTLEPMRNPDVTVRSRGIMEKCTYCVQRINQARIDAKREERKIRDGEVITACQATCPADAIVFGDLNDPASRVNALKAQARNYGVLEDLNTRPRTTYLAAIRNPNPELEPARATGQTEHH